MGLCSAAQAQGAGPEAPGAPAASDPGAKPEDLSPEDLSPEERARRLATAPPPAFMADKSRIPDEILLEKREGRNVTGFPELGYDQENGFVLGAQLQLFLNGSRDDGFFANAPYRARVLLAARRTTGEVSELEFGVDVPYALDTPFRFRLGFTAVQTPIANYYGVGRETMRRLRFPGEPGTFRRRENYEDALRRSPDAQTTYARYSQWRSTALRVSGRVEHDLLSGVLRPLLGVALSYRDVDDYTNRSTNAESPEYGLVRARQLSTRLREDHQRGRIEGFRGGFDTTVKLGLTYDTRDFEPDPASGLFVMAGSEISSRYLASEFDYQRLSLTATGYLDLLPGFTRLILAGRVAYSTVFGQVPFYELGSFARTDQDLEGLGGYQTLRGYQRARFVGRSMALASAELRWAFAEVDFLGSHFRLMAVGFADAGRAFEDSAEFHLRNWRYGYGAAFRFSWNLSTVISFDYGLSREDSVFYVSIGHPF